MLLPYLSRHLGDDVISTILDFLGPHKVLADGQIIGHIDPKSPQYSALSKKLATTQSKTTHYIMSDSSPIYTFTPQFEYKILYRTVVTLSGIVTKQNDTVGNFAENGNGCYELSKKEICMYHVQDRYPRSKTIGPRAILTRLRAKSIHSDDHMIVYELKKRVQNGSHCLELSRKQVILP
jgi:hypothetical protein